MALTYSEIAERYGRSRHTVTKAWAPHEAWPGPVGRRGRALEFDEGEVERFVREHVRPPGPTLEGDDEELLDIGEVASVTGYSADSVWSMIGHGRWPAPVGKRRRRDGAGAPTREWESLWRLGDIRVEMARRVEVQRPARRR